MKSIFILGFLFALINLFAQLPMNSVGNYEYLKVIEVNGARSEAFHSVVGAFLDVFKDSIGIIEFKGSINSLMIGSVTIKAEREEPPPARFSSIVNPLSYHSFKFNFRAELLGENYMIAINYISHKSQWFSMNESYIPFEGYCKNNIANEGCDNKMVLSKNVWNEQKIIAHNEIVGRIQMFELLLRNN